ncbi:hypothetical protein UG55_105438 [Frankia sp. EI5c]|uniref:hypothetical protein n=1 Tax=Frankia sp. EI5c TaxID=683316 RepID=UPI0007C39522|nr:hypothetical protein [Frankia sp. EI5c]OAA21775.1 hypothetical protein UG55_105438 [Frankia sp. EI5c]
MFDLLGVRSRPRTAHEERTAHGEHAAHEALPPSVARVAARTRLSSELLAAILTVDGRTRATLDDMERADALADVLLARRREREGRHRPERPVPSERGGTGPLRWSA